MEDGSFAFVVVIHNFEYIKSCLLRDGTRCFKLSDEVRFEAKFAPIESHLIIFDEGFVSEVHTHSIDLLFEEESLLSMVIKCCYLPLDQRLIEWLSKIHKINTVLTRPSNERESLDIESF